MNPITKHAAVLAVAGAGAAVTPATAGAAVAVTTQDGAIRPVVRIAERHHDRVARAHVDLHRTNAELQGAAAEGDRRREVEDWSARHLRKRNAKLRRENRRLRRQAAQAPAAAAGGGTATATPAHLQAIAACESGGDPGAVSSSGQYRGKYQFDHGTWASVGGTGDPAAASEAEQDQRAAMLYAQRGSAPWPVCG